MEDAFGMFYILSFGMIHHDLKIENIILNCIFETRIIDFDLIHFLESNLQEVNQSLTNSVGTLAYMYPEMQNEENYDNKTDVYSYGIVLYVILSGNLLKQKMSDKLKKTS
ncbi:hypothetical protein M9Y10_018580 [Tritrichomonas musculus]|uniref:Protein kinase domain-containing protein n=1 Tax=Tritrichomonas musculus TaxID=1915356 RepID=A0ABR2HPG7_9EUKA